MTAESQKTGWLCRSCTAAGAAAAAPARCPACGGRHLVAHGELFELAIAHLDCDAFFAAVEKRDRPELAERPVVVGGGERGVVQACCYVARLYGLRSAMPMHEARARCPDAVVLRPDFAKYRAVGHEIRARLQALTPLVEPVSIDEAYLDLGHPAAALGARSPAAALADLATTIEAATGIAVSIGLSFNKFLAKTASDLDKPRGFAVLGRAEAADFLAEQPVELIRGVGPRLAQSLHRAGLHRIGQLQRQDPRRLAGRYGRMGQRLAAFAWGRDDRPVTPQQPAKSISKETTFDSDRSGVDALAAELAPLCQKVAARLQERDLAATSVALKLKDRRFKEISRSRSLQAPTQSAATLEAQARHLLDGAVAGSEAYRLIGVGAAGLMDGVQADPPDLLALGAGRAAAEPPA